MTEKKETYSTQNLYEGAYLLAKGFKMAGKIEDGKKVRVLFIGNGVKEESLKFYNGGKAIAKELCDSYRTLKDYIFER